MSRYPGPPMYRKRTVRGRDLAMVTLRDATTSERRDYWFGAYGSPASRERYARLLAEWEASGRRLVNDPAAHPEGITIAELAYGFWLDVSGRIGPSHRAGYRLAIRVLRETHGETVAATFGPRALRDVRGRMLRGESATEANALGRKQPRRAWARPTANRLTRLIVAMYRWGVAHELVPAATYEALRALEPAPRGEGREPVPVGPADDAAIRAVRRLVSRQVAVMIDLQLCTGMRPGEVVRMRPCDIDAGGKVWRYRPPVHKTAHRGHSRTIYLGPRAQRLLRPFLRDRPTSAYLFSPVEAETDRRAAASKCRTTPTGRGNAPGTHRVALPRRRAGTVYTVASYRRAIRRACDQADADVRHKAADAGVALVADRRTVERWHPHQLRHNYATEVRKLFGVETARVLLGHRHVDVTELYAERDTGRAEEVAGRIG